MDTFLTIINAIVTVIAVISAILSKGYYKKNKALVDHANMNKALVEIEKMLNKLREALYATNKSHKNKNKGINLIKIIGDTGLELSVSYNEIHACVPLEYTENLFKLENDDGFELLKYINNYVSGDALENDVLDPDQYAKCQTQLMKMQDYLKKRIDEMPKKI